MAQLTSERLADLIAKRHACLLQLRELGQKQSAMIDAGEMGALLRLIAAKNRLIVAMQAIETELAPFHDQDPDSRNWSTPQARAACAEQAAQCRVLLEEVMRLEQENEQLMTSRRDQVASQLQASQAASTARGAYQAQQLAAPHMPRSIGAAATPHNPQRLDLRSEA